MSFRLFTSRLLRHGRLWIHTYTKQEAKAKIAVQSHHQNVPEKLSKGQRFLRHQGTSSKTDKQQFINKTLRRFIGPLSSNWKLQASKRLLYGSADSFYTAQDLAANRQFLSKDEELEGVCYAVRETVSYFYDFYAKENAEGQFHENLSLEDLDIGEPIGIGCSAVVYAAKLKTQKNFGEVSEDLQYALAVYDDVEMQEIPESSGVSEKNEKIEAETKEIQEVSPLEYPYALKIMFNYDIESNAVALIRAMHKELIPAIQFCNEEAVELKKSLASETNFLPRHPFIVDIYGVFCDQMPLLSQAENLYPMALPPSLNPNGYGRNMSLFLLMKRYQHSLRDFLNQTEVSMRDRVKIFAQLLEAVTHLNRHGIAHRDLKTDNILLDYKPKTEDITLVLSDFGSCIADKKNGLKVPYPSIEMDKGGNVALMAPEIISKQPGAFSVLDYSKSDLWACGTIAYEIFGHLNPFYNGNTNAALRSATYEVQDLPKMNDNVPLFVRKLVRAMLQKNPQKRPATDVAANILQLHLWAPSQWLKSNKMPSSKEIIQWLLYLTTKTVCEGRRKVGTENVFRWSQTDYLLICSFLSRVSIQRIKEALNWIQRSNNFVLHVI
ncbi:serine/threonine-protein kinase Pink1, mitochondrial [Culicoides brevitarsis]|uniref:serine/threonine-protein kinase Pink1, mitochondrial n=1 Tax=Culicoides brevitarsis TaxID=469753 RepID=UPI00307B2E28